MPIPSCLSHKNFQLNPDNDADHPAAFCQILSKIFHKKTQRQQYKCTTAVWWSKILFSHRGYFLALSLTSLYNREELYTLFCRYSKFLHNHSTGALLLFVRQCPRSMAQTQDWRNGYPFLYHCLIVCLNLCRPLADCVDFYDTFPPNASGYSILISWKINVERRRGICYYGRDHDSFLSI